MADLDGFLVTLSEGLVITSGTSTVKYYMMRWRDVDSVSLVYRTWVVTASPDPSGSQYTGVKSGGTAISGAVVAAEWSV